MNEFIRKELNGNNNKIMHKHARTLNGFFRRLNENMPFVSDTSESHEHVGNPEGHYL